MAIDKVIAPLLRVPLFAGLRPLQITEIARQAERIAFRRGGVITEAGRPGDGAYLIVSGDAVCKPRPGSAVLPQPVAPGSLVGELAMLVDHVYSATIVAEGRVHCLKLLRAALYAQMEADPALADHLSGALTARLTEVAIEMRRIDSLLVLDTAGEPLLDPPPMSEIWTRPLAAGTQR
ncbi:MAG: cyclic nucleotide-binding domain-containing protein [Rhizobiales bacterium]|nr:cyclic nucleotide-binding domain-containing protein [Hyphomicrobiales bacterium]